MARIPSRARGETTVKSRQRAANTERLLACLIGLPAMVINEQTFLPRIDLDHFKPKLDDLPNFDGVYNSNIKDVS
jgi:hypothetical protein